jgi:hypothetical protein
MQAKIDIFIPKLGFTLIKVVLNIDDILFIANDEQLCLHFHQV